VSAEQPEHFLETMSEDNGANRDAEDQRRDGIISIEKAAKHGGILHVLDMSEFQEGWWVRMQKIR
jgi:hypothetical protein